VRAAAVWLKVYVSLGVLYAITCGWINLEVFGSMGPGFNEKDILLALHLVGLGIVHRGTKAMNGGSRGLAKLGSVVALLLPLLQALVAGLCFVRACFYGGSLPGELVSEPWYWVVSLTATALTAVVAWIGGLKGLIVLGEPGVVDSTHRIAEQRWHSG
jgi:hypothetical protein